MKNYNNKTLHNFIIGTALLLILPLFLNGCGTMEYHQTPPATTTPEKPTISSPGAYQPVLGPAASLYYEADDEIKKGNYAQAEQLLERALKIEPKNSFYWYVLGKVKYLQRQYPQVVQLCLKSKSIAGNDVRLLQMNDQLIGKAQSRLP